MKKLINYIRSCFCKHDWERLMNNVPVYDIDYIDRLDIPRKHKWIYRCKKCGCINKITS